MLNDPATTLISLLFLVGLHALITLFYSALYNSRQNGLSDKAEAGNTRAQEALRLTEGNSSLHITYKLSVVLIRFVIAGTVVLYLVSPALSESAELNGLIGVIAVAITAAITLVLGDIVPEGIGSAYSESIGLWAVYPMRLLILLLKPLAWILLLASRGIATLFGSRDHINVITEEEILTMVNAGHTDGAIEEQEKSMIYSVLRLDQTTARELMTPRMDIVALDVNTTLNDSAKEFINTGFSRIPVYEENIDNLIGLLYAKDILKLYLNDEGNGQLAIRDYVRPAHFIPETKSADELLKELQDRNVHMAIVVDEYGGTAGLVTIENLIEEIVGDIRDEHDGYEPVEYTQISENIYIIDASMDLDDLNDLLGTDLETENADTLGGYIFLTLGRVPDEGEEIETDVLKLQVQSLEGRRIRNVQLIYQPPIPETETTQEPSEVVDAT